MYNYDHADGVAEGEEHALLGVVIWGWVLCIVLEDKAWILMAVFTVLWLFAKIHNAQREKLKEKEREQYWKEKGDI